MTNDDLNTNIPARNIIDDNLNVKVTTPPNATSGWILRLNIKGTIKLEKTRKSSRIKKTSPQWIKK